MTETVNSSAPADVFGSHYLTDEQLDVLLRPIRPTRVSRDGKGFSHVEAYEIRAHLNRVFGFCRWSSEVIDQQMVFESSQPSPRNADLTVWTVCYRSLVRLTVCAPDGTVLSAYTEGATGDASNMPSRADAHDMALKTSESQAFKRAAVNIGDQYGLGLYDKGSQKPLVRHTVLYSLPVADAPGEVDAHLTTSLAPENGGEPDTSARETSSPAPAREPRRAPASEEPTTPAPAPPPADGVNAKTTSAMGGHDGADPAPDGDSAAPTEPPAEPSQPSAVSGQGPKSEPAPVADGPLAEVVALINAMALQSPEEAIRTIGTAMTMAVRHQLRNTPLPDDPNMTIGAVLTARMRQAQAAKLARSAS